MSQPADLEKTALRMPTIDAGVRIGHVHLKVAALQRALDFYCGVLGFEQTTGGPGAAFAPAGGERTTSRLKPRAAQGSPPTATGPHRPQHPPSPPEISLLWNTNPRRLHRDPNVSIDCFWGLSAALSAMRSMLSER